MTYKYTDVLALSTTILRSNVIRIKNSKKNISKKFKLKIGEELKVKLRYKKNKTYDTRLKRVKNGKNPSPVYNLYIPTEIQKSIKYDFYYSNAIAKNIATTDGRSIKTDEFVRIKFPSNKKDPFLLEIYKQNNAFQEIKDLLIADQSFSKFSIRGKLVKHHSGWRKRADLTKIKAIVSMPIIYYLADKNYEKFYIGQSKIGLSRLTDKGEHIGTYMKNWEYFRYTEYNLDKTSKKHCDLLTEIEKDHIKSFSRQVVTPKVKTAKNYSIKVFYCKSVAGNYKLIKLHNIEGVNDK